MGFQSSVAFNQGYGVVGEYNRFGPSRGQSLILESDNPANNEIGRAFTIKSEGKAEAGGDGAFAGILAWPKEQVSDGTLAGGPLAATLVLPNQAQAGFITMGEINVYYNNAFTIGQGVYFDNRDGKIYAGTAAGGYQEQIVGAYVSRQSSGVAGIGALTLNTQQS